MRSATAFAASQDVYDVPIAGLNLCTICNAFIREFLFALAATPVPFNPHAITLANV